MNAPTERWMELPGADPAGRPAATFDMPAVLAATMVDQSLRISPVASAARIAGGSLLVGHSSPLVEMGLLATLRRLTVHEVATLDELKALATGKAGTRNIDVIVADRALAGQLARFVASLDRTAGNAAPKILLIGADAGLSSARLEAPASYDARLPLECRQDDLVETVNALVGAGTIGIPARSTRANAPASIAWPAQRPVPGADGVAHKIEGFTVRGSGHSIANSPPRGGLPPGALRRVREAMEQRLADKLELTELAAVAGVSRSHFARAFKESVGEPPHRYLMLRRIDAASRLIRDTDRTLTEISLDIGFFDQSHFARVFTRIVGETPSAYRRKHR